MVALKKSNLGLKGGLTLVELLLAAMLLTMTLTGLLLVFLNVALLNETNRYAIIAYGAAQSKMEEVKSKTFDQLCLVSAGCPTGGIVNNATFALPTFAASRGQGRIEILYATNTTTDLKSVRVYACFKGRHQVGDSITNCRSSPCELKTMVAK